VPAPPKAPAPAPPAQPQLTAPPSANSKPAAPSPAAQAPAATKQGSAQARGASERSAGGRKATARRSARAADRAPKANGRRGGGVKARASGDAGSAPSGDGAGTTDVAIASQAAEELPEDASPANLPFTGLQLVLMAIGGVVAILGGMALRRSTRHPSVRRAAP
jgi:hypothetical protein